MHRAGVRSIITNTLYSSGARFVSVLARAVYVVLIAKLLGPELYGLFTYGLSWYLLFVPLTVMGLDFILLREIGRQRPRTDLLVDCSLAVRGLSSVIVSIACLGLGWSFETESQMKLLLLIFSLALFGRGLASWTNAIFKGHEVSHWVLRQEVAFRLLEVVLGITLLILGYGLLTLATIHAATWMLQGVVGVSIIRKTLYSALRPRWDLSEIMNLLKKGLPFVAAAFLLSWLIQGPLIMFRHLSNNETELGQLALALQVFIVIGSVVAELGSAAIPVLSRSVERKDGKSSQFVEAVLRGGWLLLGTLTIGALALGGWVVDTLFGESYEETGVLVSWAAALVGLYFWAINLRSVLVAQGKHRAIVVSNLAGAVVFSVAFFPFFMCCDAQGVFMALGLGLSVLVGVQLVPIAKSNPVDWRSTAFYPALVVLWSVATCQVLTPHSPWLGLGGGLASLIVLSIALGVVSWSQIRIAVTSIG